MDSYELFSAQYGLKSCNCKENENDILFIRIAGMGTVTDVTGTILPYHEIIEINENKGKWEATVHKDFTILKKNPIRGWQKFNNEYREINIKILPKFYMGLKYTVLASPDSYSTYMRICIDGKPKVYSLQEGLEIVTSADMNIEELKKSGKCMLAYRKLIELFATEFLK